MYSFQCHISLQEERLLPTVKQELRQLQGDTISGELNNTHLLVSWQQAHYDAVRHAFSGKKNFFEMDIEKGDPKDLISYLGFPVNTIQHWGHENKHELVEHETRDFKGNGSVKDKILAPKITLPQNAL